MKPILALALIACAVAAATSPDVLDFFGGQADALANADAPRFMSGFDDAIPGYVTLQNNVESLVAGHDVESKIEVVTDEGDQDKRSLALDWVLIARDRSDPNGSGATRREVVKCKIERRGKKWKITAFEPIEFFKF